MSQPEKTPDREEVSKFIHAVEGCFQKIGNQRLSLDVGKLSALIAASPQVAARYVEVCALGAYSQPAQIKVPFIIATILQENHSMSEPLALVQETAEQIGAVHLLAQIPMARTNESFRSDGPERDAAKQWWDTIDLDATSCDRCDKRLRRGQGFVVPSASGSGAGFDLICQSCFDLHLSRAQSSSK